MECHNNCGKKGLRNIQAVRAHLRWCPCRPDRQHVTLERNQGARPAQRTAPVKDSTDTVPVRISYETITLPAEMFLSYRITLANHPQYRPTKAEWLQQVVSIFTIEHAEEIGLKKASLRFIQDHLPK